MDVGDLGGQGGGGFLDGLLNMFPGSSGSNPAAGMMVPSWLAALKQWQNAGKYRETAQEASKYGDPFGQANRNRAQQMLWQTYDDPTAFLNDPGHLARTKFGQDRIAAQNASKGYLGSGNMTADMMEFQSNLDAQHLDNERARLTPLTGAQFNPAAAGEMLLRGNDQAIESENNALDNLMMPFLMNMGQNRLNGQQGGGQGGNMANGLPRGINMNDPRVAEYIRSMTGGDTPWNNGGYNQFMDADGDGTVSYDEWTSGNNADLMEQLGGQNGGLWGGWGEDGFWNAGGSTDPTDPFGIGGYSDDWVPSWLDW